MDLTRLAVLLATSLALWTNCLFATGLDVLEEASRQALHKAEVCLATIVAAERTLGKDNKWILPAKKHQTTAVVNNTAYSNVMSASEASSWQKNEL